MISRKERYVGIFEFSIRATGQPDYPSEVSLWPFQQIQNVVIAARETDSLVREAIEEDRLFIVLDDLEIDASAKTVSLLFTVVDADAADTVYRKLKSDSERIVEKGPDEGGAASAHLIIDLNAPANVFRYRAALEEIEGVSRSRILPFLENLLREHGRSVVVIVDGEAYEGQPKVELQSVHQDKLSDAAGRPIGVELVHLERRRKMDGLGLERFREVSRFVRFSIDKHGPVSRALDALKEIRRRQQEDLTNYPLMRVRWQRPDLKTQTVQVDSIADDLLQRALTRLERVTGFRKDLRSASTRVRIDFVAKVVPLLKGK